MHAHLISFRCVRNDCQICPLSLSLSLSPILSPSLSLVSASKESRNSFDEIAAADRGGSASRMATPPGTRDCEL